MTDLTALTTSPELLALLEKAQHRVMTPEERAERRRPTPHAGGGRAMKPVICPRCGNKAPLTGTRFGPRHDCCGLRSWGGKPLVDEAVITARKHAHTKFDVLWKSGQLSRSKAYARLAEYLNLPRANCHIAQFDVSMCRRVVEFAKLMREAAPTPAWSHKPLPSVPGGK